MELDVARLLAQYGLLAVFVGSLIEGEMVLILAGFAAHKGYLAFPGVVLAAFCGGALGDEFWYFAGRLYGKAVFERFPRLKVRMATVEGLILRYHSAVIVLVRFMYGLRVAGPVLIGASGVPPLRFVVFNALGAALWALLVGGAGYLFGNALEWLLEDVKRYEYRAMAAVAAAWAVVALWRRFTGKRQRG